MRPILAWAVSGRTIDVGHLRARMLRALLIVPLLAAGIALGAPRPAAAAALCDTGPVTVIGATIKDNVVVKSGKMCNLEDVTIQGGVTVEPGGAFSAIESEIRGSVSGTDVNSFLIYGGVVRGGVTVAGASLYLSIKFAEVRGSVALSEAATFSGINGSSVRGSVTMNDNPEIHVGGNTIGGHLACANNDSATNYGDPSTVGGVKSGDCANL